MLDFLTRLTANSWTVLLELAPWLLLGGLVAGALHVWLPPDFIKRHLGGRGIGGILKAVMLGVPMPLCSCGVIPAAIGLKKDGASDGAATGFLISTPQTGVDSILVSASFLGWPFAIFKVVSAFITGILGGVLVDVAGRRDVAPPVAPEASSHHTESGSALVRLWRYAVDDLLYMIWRWLVFGVLVSALLTTLLPADRLGDTLLGNEAFAIFFVVLLSVPLYVCATASVPIAAALVHAGMPPGAALVFLMAGPATNMATIGSVYRAFGKRVLAIYLGVIIVGSVVLGYAFQFIIGAPGMTQHMEHQHGNPALHGLYVVCALLLLAFIARFAWTDFRLFISRRRAAAPASADVDDLTLDVSGMTCQGCVKRVESALRETTGVAAVTVDLDSGTASVRGAALERDALCTVVRDVGFGCT